MKLSIWDTAGQEKFDSLTKLYFNNTEAALIVYDVTSELSFEKVKKWVQDLADIGSPLGRGSLFNCM